MQAALEARKLGKALPSGALPALNTSVDMQSVETMVEEVIVEKVVSQTIDVTDEVVKQKQQELQSQMQSLEAVAKQEVDAIKSKQVRKLKKKKKENKHHQTLL